MKARALQTTRKDARCAADGNELLRFHCTTLTCSLGSRGSSSLCSNLPGCGVCTVIRHGFQGKSCGGGGGGATGDAISGVRTTASSGRADDLLRCNHDARRVMLVCRVIAGRVKRVDLPPADSTVTEQKSPAEDNTSSGGAFDSVAVNAGVYSNLEELVVYNPRAILPCFVVIYKVLESWICNFNFRNNVFFLYYF